MEILRICPEEQILVKNYVIKHLILLRCNGYHRGLALLDHKLFDKKASSVAIKSGIMSNQHLLEELRKPIIKKNIYIYKVYSSLKDNIWEADLVDM